MIAKKYRVNSSKIDYIMKKGDSASSKLFLVKFKKNPEQFSRYSVIISKKVASKAATRNLLRRRAYESLRLHIPFEKNEHKPHFDVVLIAKKYIHPSSYQAVETDLKNIQLTLLPHVQNQ